MTRMAEAICQPAIGFHFKSVEICVSYVMYNVTSLAEECRLLNILKPAQFMLKEFCFIHAPLV